MGDHHTRSSSLVSSTGTGSVPGSATDEAAILRSVVVRIPVPASADRGSGARGCRRGRGLGGGRGGRRLRGAGAAELGDLAIARRRRGRRLGRRSCSYCRHSGGGTDLGRYAVSSCALLTSTHSRPLRSVCVYVLAVRENEALLTLSGYLMPVLGQLEDSPTTAAGTKSSLSRGPFTKKP